MRSEPRAPSRRAHRGETLRTCRSSSPDGRYAALARVIIPVVSTV